MLNIEEISYRTSRSSGSGGQNVNKVETAVEAFWHIASSESFTQEQKEVLAQKLKNRINRSGFLQIRSTEARTQLENKALATTKLLSALESALKKDKPRRATKIPRAVKEKNKLSKLHHALKKEQRKKSGWYES